MTPTARTPTLLGWQLEDFNPDLNVEDTPQLDVPEPEAGSTAAWKEDDWLDGYMHAIRTLTTRSAEDTLKPALLEAVREIEGRLLASVEDSALLVAQLLIETIRTFERERWADATKARVQQVSDLVRPALMSTLPQISVRTEDGETIEISAQPCVIEAQGRVKLADQVCLSWHLGKAEARWSTTLQETVSALAPLFTHLNIQEVEAA